MRLTINRVLGRGLASRQRVITFTPLRSLHGALSPTPPPASSKTPLSDIDIPSPQIPPPDASTAATLTLPDGRKLGYAQYGSPTGHPFIFIHGIPDCRLDCCFTPSEQAIAKRLDIRWIAIDRPGIGLSSPHPGRTILSWPKDLQHLIKHLRLDTYRVFSVSGGTAYALACALALPREKLLCVGIMAGMGPAAAGTQGMSVPNRIGMTLWKRVPWFMTWLINRSLIPTLMDPDRSKTEAMFRKKAAQMSAVADRDFFGKEQSVQLLTSIFKEVYRQGTAKWHAEEMKLVAGHWGFELEGVTHGNVKMWYGTQDVNTPLDQGRFMAERIPGAVLQVYEGKTHFNTYDHAEEILGSMLNT